MWVAPFFNCSAEELLGLAQILSSKEEGERAEDGGARKKSKADQAKELLAKYGGAYLATSITLSLISFSLCCPIPATESKSKPGTG